MKKLIEMRNSKKGFTLVEIIVVLAILAVLIAVAMPNLMGILKQSKAKVMLQDARAVYVAIQDLIIEGETVDEAGIKELVTLPDAGGTCGVTIVDGKVTAFSYTNRATLDRVAGAGTPDYYVNITSTDGNAKLSETAAVTCNLTIS